VVVLKPAGFGSTVNSSRHDRRAVACVDEHGFPPLIFGMCAAQGADFESRYMKSIYVGNLPFSATEEDLRELFSAYGTVHVVKLVTDRETGKPRGFGFVDMDDASAVSAISALNGKEVGGRSLRINEARGRSPRSDRKRY